MSAPESGEPTSTAPREVSLPIRARLAAMSERTRALFEYHFDNDGRCVFTIASDDEAADVIIVDHDYPGVRADIDKGRWRSEAPLMVLTHNENLSIAAAVVLHKPLDRARLDAAALTLLTIEPVSTPGPTPGPVDPVSTTTRPANPMSVAPVSSGEAPPIDGAVVPSVQATSSRTDGEGGAGEGAVGDAAAARARHAQRVEAIRAARERAEKARRHRQAARVTVLCGEPRAAADFAMPDDRAHRYEPGRYPLAHLRRAQAACDASTKGLSLVFDDVELYVLPWLHRILTTVSLERRDNVERLFRPFEDAEVAVTAYTRETIDTLVDQANRRACHAFSPESFTWLGALFAARGRLPFDVDITRPYRLRYWPNLTRLERIPEDVRIAAAWSSEARSIEAMFALADFEPRCVSAFHVGALSSGLLVAASDDEAGGGA